MVLNPHGIEPNFLKFNSWSLGKEFIFIITTILDKGKRLLKNKSLKNTKKILYTFLKWV